MSRWQHPSQGAQSPQGPAGGEHHFASRSEAEFQPIIRMGQQQAQKDGDHLGPSVDHQESVLFKCTSQWLKWIKESP